MKVMAKTASTTSSVAKLHRLLGKMFDLVDEQLASALNAAFTGDEELAETVHKADDKVDRMEIEVDRAARELLALKQLTDADRRHIITAIKVNTDLERVGDHAKNIAKQVDRRMPLPRKLFEEMADAARAILYDAQDALLQRDRAIARSVLDHEHRVSRLHQAAVQSAVAQCRADPATAESMAHLIGVSKSLDRIGDHATNIAESVVFWIEGVDVRHGNLHRTNAAVRAPQE